MCALDKERVLKRTKSMRAFLTITVNLVRQAIKSAYDARYIRARYPGSPDSTSTQAEVDSSPPMPSPSPPSSPHELAFLLPVHLDHSAFSVR